MKEKTDVIAAIYKAIDEINRQLPAEKRLVKDKSAVINTKALDSLNMVNFLLGVEEQLQLDCDLEIDLGASLSPTAEVPFTNVAELAQYVLKNSENNVP
jgi:acyl carrier protein